MLDEPGPVWKTALRKTVAVTRAFPKPPGHDDLIVADRSALVDCVKLATSDIAQRRAVLIYGFDDRRRPLRIMIDAFEALACRSVSLGSRAEAQLGSLVHPVHSAGAVFGWEVQPLTSLHD
ncbi:MAG TPA: hypothetical protein VFA27_07115 [Vicinamibacterales bacterium]|nr:hypothetical protein [Vicinamibacterales bacterium]